MNHAEEVLNNKQVTLSVDEAIRICKRLENDASYDKVGSAYYTLKEQIKDFEE